MKICTLYTKPCDQIHTLKLICHTLADTADNVTPSARIINAMHDTISDIEERSLIELDPFYVPHSLFAEIRAMIKSLLYLLPAVSSGLEPNITAKEFCYALENQLSELEMHLEDAPPQTVA